MPIIVTVNLRMAVEANRNRIRDVVVAAVCGRPDVISFDLNAAIPMADAAPSVTGGHQLSNVGAIEGHDLTFRLGSTLAAWIGRKSRGPPSWRHQMQFW